MFCSEFGGWLLLILLVKLKSFTMCLLYLLIPDLVLHVILHNKWKECIVFFLEGAVFDELVSSMLVQLLRTVVADLLVQQQDFKSNRQWFRQN